MTAYLAPDPIQSTQLIPGGNVPAVGGQLFVYLAGTSTKQNSYTDSSASTARTNPIVLDSGGNIPGNGEVWIASTAKFVLAPSTDTDPPGSPYWTRDYYPGINNPNDILDQWVGTNFTPVFVNSSTLVINGDQTATLTRNRRIKTTNTAGTIYSYIVNSALGSSSTTIQVLSDSGGLDSGLSAISYALLSASSDSIPQQRARRTVELEDFGAVGDGVTDDTIAVSTAILFCDPGGPKLKGRQKTYLLTSSMPPITGQFSLEGEGRQQTIFLFNPSAVSSACFTLNNGVSQVINCDMRSFGIRSTNTTIAKVALDLYDITTCNFEEIYIYGNGATSGPSAGVSFSGGNNSIGIRTHGRGPVSLKGIEIVADKPIVVSANPNVTSDLAQEMDTWSWSNCYLLPYLNYAIAVDDGLGLQNVTFRDQNWVGGTGGFYLNDTRAAPSIYTHDISFYNVRGEQGTDVNGYWFNVSSGFQIANLELNNVQGGVGTQGIWARKILQMNLRDVTMATSPNKTSVAVAPSAINSVVSLENSYFSPGSVVSFIDMLPSSIREWEPTLSQAPSNANYIYKTQNAYQNWFKLGSGAFASSAPSNTNENVLASITVPAKILGARGTIQAYTSWEISSTATLRVRYSSSTGTVFQGIVTTGPLFLSLMCQIENRTDVSAQVGASPVSTSGLTLGHTGALPTAAVSTDAADTTLVITGQKGGSSSDTLTLHRYFVQAMT